MQFSYMVLPFLLFALFAAAETYLMMRPTKGNLNLYFYWSDEMPHLRPYPTTRYYVQQFASGLNIIMAIIGAFFSYLVLKDVAFFVSRNWPKRLLIASLLCVGLNTGIEIMSIFTGIFVNCFAKLSFRYDDSPQKYIADLIYRT